MKIPAFDLRSLLDIRPGGGRLTLAGERAIVVDSATLGLMRRELVETLGQDTARGLLTRAGFADGRRTARLLEHARDWTSPREWQRAGALLQMVQGMVTVEPAEREPDDDARPFAECVWRESYEADQHLEHLGWSDDPVCWNLCGFASGYLTQSTGAEILCVETHCRGRGDDLCRLEGRALGDWGADVAADLAFYRRPDATPAPTAPPDAGPGALAGGDPASVRPLADVERDHLLAALQAHDGHRARTARALGIGEATLYRKLKRYGD